jgi:hypothetical protein
MVPDTMNVTKLLKEQRRLLMPLYGCQMLKTLLRTIPNGTALKSIDAGLNCCLEACETVHLRLLPAWRNNVPSTPCLLTCSV